MSVGQTAPLSEEGYNSVLHKGTDQMEAFITRLVQSMQGSINDMGGLEGFAPFYSGEKAAQSFERLVSELLEISGRGGFVHIPPPSGATAPLNEAGYKMIIQKGTPEMETFVRRVAASLGLTITNEGSLDGFTPFYSGEKSVQSFARLQEELLQISRLPDGWVKGHAAAPPQQQPMAYVPAQQPVAYAPAPVAPNTAAQPLVYAFENDVTAVAPPGVPPGSRLITEKYAGGVSLMCCLCGGLCCPCDERQVWLSPSGVKYDIGGQPM